MALTKVTGQVVNTSTDLTVGVLTATTASFTGNVSVGGTLTYEDVTNVDSVGLITARNGIEVTDKGVQVGTGATVDSAAANTLTFLTNGSERLRINSDGLVTVGGNETVSAATGVQIENAGAALLTLLRNDLTISDGNTLGGIDFYGNDGGTVQQVAKISAVADGTHGNNDKPTRLVFSTTADGGSSATERARIDSSGVIRSIGNTSGTYENLLLTDGTSNSTTKRFGINCVHYNTAEEDFTIIHGASSSSENVIKIGGNNSATTTNDATNIRFYTAANQTTTSSSERMRIDSSGNVGIGAQSPDGTLHVHSGTAGSVTANGNADDLIVESSGTGGISILTPDASHGYIMWGSPTSNEGAILRYRDSDNLFTIGTEDSDGQIVLRSGAGSEAARFDSSGNFGLGTSSPGEIIDVIQSAQGDAATLRIRNSADSDADTNVEIVARQSSRTGGRIVFGRENANSWNSAAGYASGFISFNPTNAGSDVERVRIDSSGRLLIGTSFEGEASADNLTINDSGNCGITIRSGTNNFGSIYFSDATSGAGEYDGYIAYNQPNRYMQFAIGQSERMRIDSSGRVIIGDTDADNAHANGDDLIIGNTSSGKRTGLTLVSANDQDGQIIFSDGTSSGNANIQGQIVYDHSSNHLALYTTATEQVRIDSVGRLMVGATSADAKFVVRQSQNTTAATFTNPHVKLSCSGTTNSTGFTGIAYPVSTVNNYGWTVGGQRISSSGTDGAFVFRHHNNSATGNERMRILSYGSLRVSTDTSDSDYAQNTSDYWHVFHTNQNNQVTAIFENSANSTPSGMFIDFSDAAPDNNSSLFLKCLDSSANRMFIYSDGDIDNHDNSYGAISDVKLKQDIVDAGSQWDDIKDLRVRKFKFKSDVDAYGDEAKTLIGVVAQETELVSPGLVRETPDKDRQGNDLGTTTKSVRYSVLYMKAIKALQEAQTRIETLESQHADLLARVAALEG